jgi:hypothetical protein
MYISEIRTKYNNGDYTYKTTVPTKVASDHIFDAELSVRRNRELVKEHNDNVNKIRQEARQEQLTLDKQLTDDVVEYIMAYYDLTEQQARTVESFTYKEHHSSMYDYFSYIDTYADFAFYYFHLRRQTNDRL